MRCIKLETKADDLLIRADDQEELALACIYIIRLRINSGWWDYNLRPVAPVAPEPLDPVAPELLAQLPEAAIEAIHAQQRQYEIKQKVYRSLSLDYEDQMEWWNILDLVRAGDKAGLEPFIAPRFTKRGVPKNPLIWELLLEKDDCSLVEVHEVGDESDLWTPMERS